MSISKLENINVETALAALREIDERDLPPTPENYCIWTSHLMGANPELSEELRSILKTNGALASSDTQRLFEKHFAQTAIGNQFIEAGGFIQAEIAAVIETLAAAGQTTRAFGETLEEATDELEDVNTPVALGNMIARLTSATQEMQRHSEELEDRLASTAKEVDSLRASLESVRKEALTDGLTGVANRKRFDETLSGLVAQAAMEKRRFVLVLGDIDHFKRFNDTWGHQTGDQIIRLVASTMSRHAEDHHLVARYGGEEFAILLPDAALSEAEELSDRIRSTIENKKLLRRSTNEDLGRVTISLGAAEHCEGEEGWQLVERADEALYKSKQNGRNRVTLAPPREACGGTVAA